METVEEIPRTMTSREVAAYFGRSHPHVMRDIRHLDMRFASQDEYASFARKNIFRSQYLDSRGKAQPLIELTEKAVLLLAAGYNSEKAVALLTKFIVSQL